MKFILKLIWFCFLDRSRINFRLLWHLKNSQKSFFFKVEVTKCYLLFKVKKTEENQVFTKCTFFSSDISKTCNGIFFFIANEKTFSFSSFVFCCIFFFQSFDFCTTSFHSQFSKPSSSSLSKLKPMWHFFNKSNYAKNAATNTFLKVEIEFIRISMK